jgi:acyl-CoA synthetase (AMP-forming)/AMP-acid ligase II
MRESWSPNKMLEVTARERIPIMLGVPTMFAMALSLPTLKEHDLSCVKVAVMSGEKVGRELLDGIRRHICHDILNGYGSTEAGAEVTFTAPGDDLALLADGYVGHPIAGQQLRIVNDDDSISQTREIGEVVVKGPLTINGYYHMPAEDAAGFTPDGWCRTGDLGFLDERGGLWIRGRKKQIIRVGGYTVIPNEIEELVAQLPGVAQAVAIGMPDPVRGEAVWLVLQPRQGETIDVDATLAVCKAQLANYKVPARVVLEADIPVTRIGKADRIELRKQLILRNV